MSNMTDPDRRRHTTRWFTGLWLVLSLGLMAPFVADIADLSAIRVSDCANPGDGSAATTPEQLTACDPDDDGVLLAPTTMGSPLALTFAMAAPHPVSLPRHQPPLVHPPKTQPTM